VRIDRTVDERIAGANALAFLHVDVHGARHTVLVAHGFVGLDDDAAHALDHRTVMHRSLNLGDDSLVARMTGFEQLDDARQTAGDVLRLGRGARDLGFTDSSSSPYISTLTMSNRRRRPAPPYRVPPTTQPTMNPPT
jgi:hypothetical protein